MNQREYKLIFTGPMGAGKTTAIRAVSEIEVVITEVANSDRQACDKATTTVAMDYGEVSLENNARLRLYGTPGQVRFAYMWPILARAAVGVIVLLDASRDNAVADLEFYLSRFIDIVGENRLVVAVGQHTATAPSLEAFNRCVARFGASIPVVSADVRNRHEVLTLLEILFSQVEMADLLESLDTEA